jgi:diguanylate cyclase (GGDEF)-like protein/PAS domain S-box-containing protein
MKKINVFPKKRWLLTEFMTQLLKTMPVPLGVSDKNGVIKAVNSRFEKLFGYTQQEIPTMKEWARLAYPDENYRKQVMAIWNNAVYTSVEEHHDIEPIIYNVTCKDQQVKMVKISGTMINDLILVTFIDVTDHKFAEELLKQHHEEILTQHEEIEAQNRELNQIKSTIEESEEKFRLMAETSVDLIFQINALGIFTYCSPSSYAFMGFQPDEMENRPFSEFITPDTLPIANDIFVDTLAGKTVRMMVIKTTKKTGEQIWIEVNTTPLHKDNEIIGLQGTARDINFRKLAEESLRQQSEIIRYFYDLPFLGMAISLVNDRHFLKINDQMCNILGYSREELRQKTWVDVTHPDDIATNMDVLNRILKGKIENYTLEKRYLKKDGSIIYAILNAYCVRAERKEEDFLVVTVQDITARKIAEKTLQESEQRYRSLVNNMPDYVMRYDRQHRHVFANEHAIRDSGKTEAEFIGTTHREMGFPEHLCCLWENAIQRCFETQTPQTEIFEWENVIGVVVLEWRVMPEYTTDGSMETVLAISRNITESKQAEKAIQESEERFRTLIENLQIGVIVQNAQAEIILNNPKALELLGLTEDQLLEKTSFDPNWNVIHEDGSPFPGKDHPVPQAIARRQSIRNVVMGVFHPSKNNRVWLLVNAVPQLNPDGSVLQVICTFNDITERRQIEEKLQHLSQAVEQGPISIVISNTDGNIEYVNPRFSQITGYKEEEVIGQNPRILKSGETPLDTYIELWHAIASGKIWRGELINKRKNGELYHESVVISPILNAHHITTHYLAIKEDITERKRSEREMFEINQRLKSQLKEIELLQAELKEQAHRDLLTGLYNRRYLHKMLEKEIEQATREQYPISFIMLDIDYFKKVNDQFGHDAGDLVLQFFAQHLIQQVRTTDIVCRYGGEEFLVVLPKTTLEDAYQMAERLRSSLVKKSIFIEEKVYLNMTLSSGVAMFPNHGTTSTKVISVADSAMYQAKELGRNRIVISE